MPARILVVEDNAANLDLMQYLLEAFGHTITRAINGRDGLEVANGTRFDIILADVLMPKVDGYEFVAKLKSGAPRCPPIVAVTALAMVGDRERLLQSGFDGYIAKPIDPETFVQEVDHYLTGEFKSTTRRGSTPLPAPAPRATDATERTILVVDDVPTNVHVIKAAIEPFGHRVLEACSMRDALVAALDELPHLVISDVHMPDGSGYDLINAFKADSRLVNIPFIFISSTYWHELDRAHGMKLGADKFLVRPIEPHLLLEEVNDTLSRFDG